MKHLFTALLIIMSVNAFSQEVKNPEKDHVNVTLNNGDVVDGYIQTYWVDGKLFKRMNTSFTMSSAPDGKDASEYSADNVKYIDFVVKTSADGKYDHLESQTVANPSTFKPKKARRQFVYKEGENDTGTIYWWNGVDSQNMQLGKMNISTIYGVCLKGDSIVVPFMTGNVISLNAMRIHYKKRCPELVAYVDKRVLKGGKRLWDSIALNPMMFLEICDEYISKHPDSMF